MALPKNIKILTEQGETMERKNYHEINRYRDALFPVAIYRVNENGIFPFGRGLRDFHWHDELQFTLAVRGSVTLQVDAGQYHLREGDAAFINSGMIHAATALSKGGQYASLNFPYKLLSFFPGSRMEKEHVLPYVTGGRLPVVILRPETEWQKAALELLQEINAVWENPSAGQREYLISTKIVALWHMLISHPFDESGRASSVDFARRERLQLMLSFIYEHFSQDVALADVARAAHISAGECCRIFRAHLQTTPHRFLTEYRIRKSVELLSGELSVTEIAERCGYHQTSHYIAAFKAMMGCTPARYRRRGREGAPEGCGKEREKSNRSD